MAMIKKRRNFFQEKIGVTPSVAAPDDQPSDVTERRMIGEAP